MKTQKGFAHAQILIILLVVAAVAAVGVLVYNSRQSKDNDPGTGSNPPTTKVTNFDECSQAGYPIQESFPPVCVTPDGQRFVQEVSVKEEDSWLLFTPENKAYSVRIPDGWSGVSLSGNLYVRETSKLVYAKGKLASVEMLTEGGWDGAGPFSLYNPGSYADQIVREGTKQGEIKTDSGLTVHKYIYMQEAEPEAIGYQKGSKVYNYYFDAPGKYIQVSHVVFPGASDEAAMVERLIKTITVN